VLREAVAKRKSFVATAPDAVVEPRRYAGEPVVQGESLEFSLQLTNNGTGPLTYRLVADCGCIATGSSALIEAGGTGLIRARFDSTEFAGDVHRKLTFVTNDPERPVFEVPLQFSVKPRFRLLQPGGNVLILPDGGGETEVFFVPDGSPELAPKSVRLEGLNGELHWESWKGMLADPQLGEEARERVGYRIRVRLDDALPPGRSTATVRIETGSEKFPALHHTFGVQKGIVALPDLLFLGEIGRSPRRAGFLVSRPGRPFQVTKVEVESPHLRATHRSVREGWEYHVDVEYPGSAPVGSFSTVIHVHTDDPAQPVVRVPVQAIVR
jgi:hypothetical protein